MITLGLTDVLLVNGNAYDILKPIITPDASPVTADEHG